MLMVYDKTCKSDRGKAWEENTLYSGPPQIQASLTNTMVPTHSAHLAVTLITTTAKWSDNLLELQKRACVAQPEDNASHRSDARPAKKPHAKIQPLYTSALLLG